jgi:hypothetical protein
MDLLESQNILLALLKIFGFFPIDFQGKIKRHLYNLVVTSVLLITFTIVGLNQMSQSLVNTTEKDSALGYFTVLMEVFSTIICFVVIKLYLLIKSGVVEKYFAELGDLEYTVRSHHVRIKKIDRIVRDLKKSTLRQEIFLIVFYFLVEFGYDCIAVTDNILLYSFLGSIYVTFNCFFIQILIFLKMNMDFARKLQNHLNQVLLNLQKHRKPVNVEDFIKIHLKIKQFLATLNKAFGFIFLVTFLEISGSMIPEIYKSILTLSQSDLEISIKPLGYIMLNFIWVSFSYYHLGRFAFECSRMEEEVIFSIVSV